MAPIFKKIIGNESYETPVYTKSLQGKSIALSVDGLTMAVGAPEHDSGIGCCFIYSRDTMTSPWIQCTNRLRGSGYKGKSRQGTCVTLSGDGNTLAIGGPDDDSGTENTFSGAVWMFKRINGSWYQVQDKIFWASANTGSDNDRQRFGESVSLSGDGMTMAIGVPRYKYDPKSSCGKDAVGQSGYIIFIRICGV